MTIDEQLGLSGRVVVVAGAGGGGIGTGICRLVAGAGGIVAALDVSAAALDVARAALGADADRHAFVVADVRDPDAVAAAVSTATQRGPLHGLVHVAGGITLAQWEPLLSMSPELFDDVLGLNLRSALITTQAVARGLVAAGSPGSIVHIASAAGLSSMPYAAAYGVAKAGLMSLTRTAAVEWGAHGIRVNAVAPGTVRTPKNAGDRGEPDTPAEQAAVPLRRRAVPDDIAGAALWLLSDLAGFVSGQVVAVDGGASARASYLDDDQLPVFVRNEQLRNRLLGR